jgi:uncharacterized protein YggU (UPF0235/DUF167 family)
MQIHVSVKLKQPISELMQIDTNNFIARVTSAPEDNRANLEIIRLLSNHFKVPKSTIELTRGAKSKTKTFLL